MKKIVVTKIINKYEVLLNVGSNDGITNNSRFEIIGTEDITDPVSKESLGILNYTKITLRVRHLLPTMCICEDSSNGTYIPDPLNIFKSALSEPKIIKNELNIDIDDYAEEQVDTAIYVGDEVKLID